MKKVYFTDNHATRTVVPAKQDESIKRQTKQNVVGLDLADQDKICTK
jgi:hypothetical protein